MIPILFQDPRFVVLNKPPGLAVHPGPRGGPSVEDCFPQLSRRKDGPWLAHRLDADTAGCLVVALRKAALIAAQQADYVGNLCYTLTAHNFNPIMAMAARTVIAEPDTIVPVGVIPPDAVKTPGALIDHILERAA